MVKPKQLTSGLGYDGGAFFSHDSKKLYFVLLDQKTDAEIKEYKDYLAQNLVAPTNMEIYTINADGTDLKQITHLGKANWAPYFTPNDKKSFSLATTTLPEDMISNYIP